MKDIIYIIKYYQESVKEIGSRFEILKENYSWVIYYKKNCMFPTNKFGLDFGKTYFRITFLNKDTFYSKDDGEVGGFVHLLYCLFTGTDGFWEIGTQPWPLL